MKDEAIIIILFSLSLRLIHTSLLILPPLFLFTPFDTSSSLLLPSLSPHLTPLLSWDSHYFFSIAKNGYTYEQQIAFAPGLPGLISFVGKLGGGGEDGLVLGGAMLSFGFTTGAALSLYYLTLTIFRPSHASTSSSTFALLTALFFLLSPSASTLHTSVAYTESLFALFVFQGMRFAYERKMFRTALACAAASAVRPMGVMIGPGLLGWELLLECGKEWRGWMKPIKNFPKFLFLSLVSISPFIVFQYWSYTKFCLSSSSRRPWCNNFPPSSYGWVQREYWDVGPFRYWTFQQLPNFLLASPIIVLSISASYTYYSSYTLSQLLSLTFPFFPLPPPSQLPIKPTKQFFTSPLLLPLIHLHTLTLLLLVVSAHIQIMIRVCVTNPVVWWFVADLVMSEKEEKRWARWWIGYAITWGGVGTVLWSGFLPPA